jgi:cell division protein ZapB
MSKITEQLQDLKLSIDNIKEVLKKIKIENSLLQQQQESLVSEKADLIKKNEAAKEQIEAILERIKNIE